MIHILENGKSEMRMRRGRGLCVCEQGDWMPFLIRVMKPSGRRWPLSQDPEHLRKPTVQISGGRVVQAQRQDGWHTEGTAGRPVWLEPTEAGRCGRMRGREVVRGCWKNQAWILSERGSRCRMRILALPLPNSGALGVSLHLSELHFPLL